MPLTRSARARRRDAALASCTAALLTALAVPVATLGDDTDIYSLQVDPNFQPSLMFMVDTSNSMRTEDYGYTTGWRRDRLIDPLVDFVRTAEGVRAGLSTFNGSRRGDAVIQPAEDLDRDLCPDADCDSITVRAQILDDDDDGVEAVDTGRVALRSHVNYLGERADLNVPEAGHANKPGRTVMETASRGMVQAETLTLFRDESGETTKIGFYFPSVDFPADAQIFHAHLDMGWGGNAYLDPDAGEGSGVAPVRITFDSREDAPPFADVDGQRVGDRPRASGHFDWDLRRPDDWAAAGSDYQPTITTPNMADAFLTARGPGTSGSVVAILEPRPGATVDEINTVALLGANSRGLNYRNPRLVTYYRDPDRHRPSYINAFRFDRLNVPQGARITSAHMELVPWGGRNNDVDYRIRAEASGDASPFVHWELDGFSARALGGGEVRWQTSERWYNQRRARTPDVASLIQEVVSRGDWCAGNALSLQIAGEGERRIEQRERGNLRAASLHVTYDPSSIDPDDTCRAQPSQDSLLLASEGDVVQRPGRDPQPGLGTFESGAAGAPHLGLRFADVNLGPDDDIAEAILTLSTVGDVSGFTRLRISIDSDTPTVPFDAATDLNDRVAGEPVVEWYTERLIPGSRLVSQDLAPLIRRALADPAWVRGSDLVLTVRRIGEAATSFATSHSSEAGGPTLRITRRGHDRQAMEWPLYTARDALVESLQTLPATGETPVVDAFYETAQYLLGGEVVHGARRGEQVAANAVHRLSRPDSYTGGAVYRPLGCEADDPGDVDCVDETIQGTATYAAPATSQCLANQIVLVTDGEPSASPTDTAARIRALTGDASCEGASDAEACAVELARWLEAGDTDRAPMRVNTIGFGFESPFLGRVADAGGGRAFSVSSAGALADALVEIGQSVKHETTSLAAPTLSISQFNRSSHRDDVYLGLFEPAVAGEPWPGNLKRYALGGLPGGGFGLVDAEGRPAVDPDTGAFASSARSYWSAVADGNAVAQGGAASRLPTQRTVLTWPAPSSGDDHGARELVAFHPDTAAIRATDLGVSEAERRGAMLWMRGLDVRDEDDDGVTDEPRRRMGAAIHTTPTVIDYASSAPDGRSVVFAGTQEGFLHGIDTASGRELFAFLPFELYGDVGAAFNALPGPMRYGLDGPVTSWTSDENRNGVVDPGESAYITVGMRRGGNHYYTLDVSDPDAPSLAWTIDASREDFEAVRQTWSAMRPATLRADPDTTPDGAATRPALVFASGYDPSSDDRTTGARRPTRRQPGGAMIYLIDPHTGDRLHGIRSTRMWYSIPSDVAVVDVELDGVTDLLLVGDVAGQLWRVDLDPSSAGGGASATTGPEASVAFFLSEHTTNTNDPWDRRFFHSPDVALMSDGSGTSTLGVAIGSGRRDDPLGTAVQDRLYMLTLDLAGPGPTLVMDDRLVDATDGPATLGPNDLGWYIDLERPGEKILGSPVIIDGKVMVTSYVPPADGGDPCEPNLGTGRLYSLDAFDASPSFASSALAVASDGSIELDSPGIPPPVTVVLSDERPGSPAVMAGTESVDVLAPMPVRQRIYWVSD